MGIACCSLFPRRSPGSSENKIADVHRAPSRQLPQFIIFLTQICIYVARGAFFSRNRRQRSEASVEKKLLQLTGIPDRCPFDPVYLVHYWWVASSIRFCGADLILPVTYRPEASVTLLSHHGGLHYLSDVVPSAFNTRQSRARVLSAEAATGYLYIKLNVALKELIRLFSLGTYSARRAAVSFSNV